MERLLRATEVATVLGVGRAKAYQMMRTGELKAVNIGRAVRVRAGDLEAHIKALPTVGGSAGDAPFKP